MKRSSVIIFYLIINISYGQITFEKTFSGAHAGGSNICEQTADTGYIIMSTAWDNGFNRQTLCLIKLNISGDTSWTKVFISDGSLYPKMIRQMNDGGYLIGGDTGVYMNGDYCLFIMKTDISGNRIWMKSFKMGSWWANFNSAFETHEGGIIVTGDGDAFGAGSDDIYLIKCDSNGDTLWTKCFSSIHTDIANSVIETSNGDLLLTGEYDGRLILLKCDSTGTLIWAKTFGGSMGEVGYCVYETSQGDFIAAGYTFSFGNHFGNTTFGIVYIIKTDLNGDTIWTKTFSTTGRGGSIGKSIVETSDNGFIICGEEENDTAASTQPDCFLMKIDSNGNFLWAKKYGGLGSDYGNYSEQVFDGGYIMSGTNLSFGLDHGYLVKTDSVGNSFCNDSSIVFIPDYPPTLVTSIFPQITSGISLINPVVRDSSGAAFTTLCTSVNVQSEKVSSQLEIFLSPNPTSEIVTIKTRTMLSKASLDVLNLIGEKLISIPFNNQEETINVSEFPLGIYLLTIRTENGCVATKLIIE